MSAQDDAKARAVYHLRCLREALKEIYGEHYPALEFKLGAQIWTDDPRVQGGEILALTRDRCGSTFWGTRRTTPP